MKKTKQLNVVVKNYYQTSTYKDIPKQLGIKFSILKEHFTF